MTNNTNIISSQNQFGGKTIAQRNNEWFLKTHKEQMDFIKCFCGYGNNKAIYFFQRLKQLFV